MAIMLLDEMSVVPTWVKVLTFVEIIVIFSFMAYTFFRGPTHRI